MSIVIMGNLATYKVNSAQKKLSGIDKSTLKKYSITM